MACSVPRLVAFAEMGVNAEIVAHRVLPSVIVGAVERVLGPETGTIGVYIAKVMLCSW